MNPLVTSTREPALADGHGTLSNPAAFHAARQFIDLPCGRIAFVERGEGPVAMLFHGYPLNGFQWRSVIDRLSAHRRCVAADFIGLDYSEASPSQDVSPHAQAYMIVAFLDACAIPAIDIVASDSGGTIAQIFAAQNPRRVRSLLLANCDVSENSPPEAFLPTVEAARSGTLAKRFVARALADRAYARSEASLGAFYTDPESLTDECIETYLRPLVSSEQRIAQFHAFTAAFLPNPLLAIEPALRQCQAPARMVWGTAAPAFGVEWAFWLDQALPNSRGVRLVEGANLFFPEERPDLIAEEAITLWSTAPERRTATSDR